MTDDRRIFNDEEVEKLKNYWRDLREMEADFEFEIKILENMMQKDLKIKDIEFFNVDGKYLGVGNRSRSIKLISFARLED